MSERSPSPWALSRNEAVWERRAHPASFWMRLSLVPLMGLVIWSRQWIDPGFLVLLLLLVVIAWVSERVFPPASGTPSWATRAALGERLLSSGRRAADLPRGLVRALLAVGTIGTIVMVSGAILYDLGLALGGVVVMLVAKLAAFDRLARAWSATAATDPEVEAWQRPH